MVGTGYLALGGLMLLGALGALGVSRIVPFPPEQPLPAAFDAVLPLFESFGRLAALQVALGLLVVVSSLAFLRGRRWSRLALDVVTVASTGWTVYFGVLWQETVYAMTVGQGPARGIRGLGIAMMVMGALVAAAFVLVAALAVRYLHGGRVEAHLMGNPEPRNPMVR
jgi:hypothetical protein